MKRYKNLLAILLALLTLCGFVVSGFANETDASQPEGHRVLVSGSSLDKIAIMDYDGSILWQVPQSELGWTEVNDADLLPNGNLVFAVRASSGSTVYMIRPDYPNSAGYETLWTYQIPAGGENHTCQYLPDGGILVGEAYASYVRIVELDAQGNIRKTLGSADAPLTDLPVGTSSHGQIRQVHKTAEGTYLVASQAAEITVEYSADGEKLAEYPAGGFVAVKDKDGNVIVSGGASLKITCFAPDGTQLWQIGQDDLPDVSLAWLAAVEPLDNGNIVFANWGGHEGSVVGDAVIEVTVPTADNPCQIVWSLDSGKNTSNVQILDHISDSIFDGTQDAEFESTSQNYRSPLDLVGSLLNDKIFVADETNNTVDVIRHSTGKLIGEIQLNQKPNTLLLSADGRYLYVATGGSKGKVEAYNAETYAYAGSVSVGHTPSALALSSDGSTLYVANRFNGTVQTVALTDGIIAAETEATEGVFVTREPMSMAITDGKLYVGGHLPTGSMNDGTVSSEIVVVNTATMKVAKTVTMVSGSTNLKDLALSPDGEYLYASHALGRYNVATTHVDRGWIYTNAITEIRTSDDTVRATMLVDDLDLGAANPWGIDVSNDTIVLSISGTRELMILDRAGLREKIEAVHAGTIGGNGFLENAEDISVDLTFTTEFKTRVNLGEDGPRGIELLGDKVYTANYYGGSISIYNMDSEKLTAVELPTEKAEDAVRGGERLWNDATICMGQWQSCASCHPDARTDALNWDNMNDGIGTPKQARSMVGSWDRGRVMATGIRPNTMAANRAGLKYICFNEGFPENEMLKIDAFTQSLKAEESPYLVDGKLTESALRGKVLFEGKANCASCHAGDLYGADILIYDNYVQSETETRGLLVPPLVEAWRTAPYLHDGSAATILDVLTTRNVTGTHGNVEGLTETELDDLCNYVLSLGSDPIVVEIVPTQVSLDAVVKLGGKTLEADQFSVELFEGETLIASKTNAADGTVLFDAIVYDEIGTHTYTLKQTVGDLSGVTYDTQEYTVTVSVNHKGDGKLIAEITGDDPIIFHNLYKVPTVAGTIQDVNGVLTYVSDETGKGVEQGLIKIGDDYYYVGPNGVLVSGKYYAWRLNENCDITTGWYTFAEDGRMITDGIFDGYYYVDGKPTEMGLFQH
ncbi:MAG: hypothetical protein J6B86_06605, partial [Clostridia bacterium]|nr:hypothetical protein [Clostridia bacterium]